MNMLDAYTRALDWLQYGDEFDSDKAEMALQSIRHFKREAGRYRRALENIAAGEGTLALVADKALRSDEE
jgi:hypothetical protein